MGRLKDAVAGQANTETKTAVGAFKSSKKEKKMISAYVDQERYEAFKAINRKRGISSNQILNLMIADYVLQHEKLLD